MKTSNDVYNVFLIFPVNFPWSYQPWLSQSAHYTHSGNGVVTRGNQNHFILKYNPN